MIRKKIRVLMIEDSRLYQRFLRQIIESDDCLTVAGAADSGGQALELIPEVLPDVITLDLQLPDCEGLELLKTILQKWDLPVVVVSGDAAACADAIRLGARDFITKMQDAEPKTAEQFRLLLKLKLKMQAETKPAVPRRSPAELPGGALRSDSARKYDSDSFPRRKPAAEPGTPDGRLIAVGASLGGTETTLQILRQLPDTLPGIVIVQHMPPEYTGAYAMRLDRCCSLEVHEARNGDIVLPGTAIVAMGGAQLTVYRSEQGYRVKVGSSEKYGGFCPSVDVLFRSAAEAAGPSAMGVILTGMGRDGAEGLKAMHDARAYTLGQNQETCAVYGMPGAAEKLGAVDKLLPPDLIADEIIRFGSRHEKSEVEKR